MLLDIYGPNLSRAATPDGATFAVHAAGCAHGKRRELRDAIKHTEDHPSLVALCDEYYPPDEFECESGENADDFYIAPCARSLHGT
jgi:hypothetical protein